MNSRTLSSRPSARRVAVLGAASLMAMAAGPTAAQTSPVASLAMRQPADWTVDRSARPIQLAPTATSPRPAGLRMLLAERVTLVASGGKQKDFGGTRDRVADEWPRRPKAPKAARLGLVVDW